MTVLLTMDLPVSREILEAVSSQMGVRDDPPDGLVVHVMTETADGVHVVDVWDSVDQFTRFRDTRLLPAMGQVMEAAGIAMPEPPPEPAITEAHDIVVGRSLHAA
jgi:hypothetical protein